MKETSISVTEAARNFSDCVSRVHYQNIAFRLLKNGRPIARLVPDYEKVCHGRDLVKILENIELPAAEARAWHRALRTARKALKAPVDRWR
jgi:antitoxin (DNA-binding transcriptional repressor) of toxin-antitoxin stability system